MSWIVPSEPNIIVVNIYVIIKVKKKIIKVSLVLFNLINKNIYFKYHKIFVKFYYFYNFISSYNISISESLTLRTTLRSGYQVPNQLSLTRNNNTIQLFKQKSRSHIYNSQNFDNISRFLLTLKLDLLGSKKSSNRLHE